MPNKSIVILISEEIRDETSAKHSPLGGLTFQWSRVDPQTKSRTGARSDWRCENELFDRTWYHTWFSLRFRGGSTEMISTPEMRHLPSMSRS